MKTCVLVLGMHRSGTSALTGALEKIGVALPHELLPANDFNEKGYFEGKRVMLINDQILSEVGSTWDDTCFVITIPEDVIEKHLPEVKQFIEQEFAYSKVFALKDPRMCITFPVWERALNELAIDIKVVFPYRNPFETARSLKKRDHSSTEKSILLWAKHVLQAEQYSRAYCRYFLGFNQFLKNVPEHLKNIAEFLGMHADQSAIDDVQNNFIETPLKHHNLDSKDVAENVPVFIKQLLALVQNDSLASTKAQDWDDIFQEVSSIFQFMYAHDVQSQTQISRDLQAQSDQTNLRAEKLEKIKDIIYVDAEYYKAKYADIDQHDIEPTTHFMEYGKNEGRYPNSYCEFNQINVKSVTSASESLYLTQKQLTEKQAQTEQSQAQINVLESEKAGLVENQEQLNQDIVSLLKDLEAIKEAKQAQTEQSQAQIKVLESEKAGLVENQEQLNQDIVSLLKDLEAIKEAKQAQKDELQGQIDGQIAEKQTLADQAQTFEQQLSEQAKLNEQASQVKDSQLQNVQAQLAQREKNHTEQIEQSQAQVEALESEKSDLQTAKDKVTQEVQQLSELIDNVVNDLACIKESKCWIYTKPIRDLNKVFKK